MHMSSRSFESSYRIGLCALALSIAGLLPNSAWAKKPAVGPVLAELIADAQQFGADAAIKKARGLHLGVRGDGGNARIPLLLQPAAGAAATIDTALLTALGLAPDAVSPSYMRVMVPPGQLKAVSEIEGLAAVRTPTPTVALHGTGSIVSQSVLLTGAEDFHVAGFDGNGAKVAVIDLGFIGLAAAITAGELPPGTVAVDLPGTNDNPIEQVTGHGVAVAEHVADMAPGAQIYCILVADELDLQNAATYVRDNGIQIVNHSVGWALASYYDDTGDVSAIVNDSYDNDGVFWAVSAGNQAQKHWRSAWIDADADNLIDFAPADERMTLSSASEVSLYLNWNQYGSVATDIDLYVYNNANVVVAQSVLDNPFLGVPFELLAFSYVPSEAPYEVEIQLFSGPTVGLDLTMFSFDNNLEYASAAASLMDPAPAHGAYTVGAVWQGVWASPSPPLEGFSSQGPTNDGRTKPNIVAPDGTSSSTYGSSFGTSFSSPTTAGAAALLLDEHPARTAADIAARLTATAIDAGPAGEDNEYGAGQLNLQLAACDCAAVTTAVEAAACIAFGTTLPTGSTQALAVLNQLIDSALTDAGCLLTDPCRAAILTALGL